MNEDMAAGEAGVASRRALLLGAGGVGATAFLAACGTDDGDAGDQAAEPPAAQETPTGGATGDAGAGAIAKAADIPVGGGAIFAGQQIVVTQPTQGTFKGFSSICTHMNCPLASVEGGTINCTCHGSKFAIEDGSVKNPPATRPLEEKPVRVDGDDIVLA